MGVLLDIANIDMEQLVRKVIKRAEKENRPEGEILKEELIKIAQNPCDQTEGNEQFNKTNCILAENEDIDNENEEIFDKYTGKTLRILR